VWTYSGTLPTASHDSIVDVAAFADGSVAVAGSEEDYWGQTFVAYELDWVIARIKHDGSAQWVVQLGSGQDSTYDVPERVAIDPEGNVVAGGQMYDPNLSCGPDGISCTSNADCSAQPVSECNPYGYRTFITKLNGLTGDTIWAGFFATPGPNTGARIRAFAFDAASNVLIAFASTSGLFKVVKVDGDDPTQTLWEYTEPTSTAGGALDIVLDGNGDALVAGNISVSGTDLAFAAKLEGDTGAELWRNDNLSATAAIQILSTSENDALVLSYDNSSGSTVARLARLSGSDGSLVWPLTFSGFIPRRMVSDNGAHLYLGGQKVPTFEFAMSAVDPAAGSVAWTQTYGAPQGVCGDIDLTGDGKPVCVGEIQDVNGHLQFETVAANPSTGAQAWRTTLPSYVTGNGLVIAQTAEGNVVVGGQTNINSGYGPPYSDSDSLATAALLLAADGSLTECGNGVTEQGEACDDGNVLNGDCCSATCQFESAGTACDDGLACTPSSQCDDHGNCYATAGNCCGDGTWQPNLGEACDDGNTANGDCCSSTCQFEPAGGSCDAPGATACNPVGQCSGDGYCYTGPSVCSCCSAHIGYGCDQPNCQACVLFYDSNCRFGDWSAECVNVAATTCASSCVCQSSGTCGNGVIEAGEQCDDGNTTSGDCCSSTCQNESCPACGNGILNSGEQCDDGNLTAGDCCSPECQIEDACREHFKLYKINTTAGAVPFAPQQVTLEDAFGSRTLSVLKPAFLGNPVDKQGEGIIDDTMHLECYKTKDGSGSQVIPSPVVVRNQFSLHFLTVTKASSLCMPTAKNGVATDLGADRFRCYKVKGAKISATVTLQDQFETKVTVVEGAPKLLCNPAQQTLAMIEQPERRLLCYKIKDAKLDPPQPKFVKQAVTTENSFGNESLTASKAALLCVPSL
jgi:cysteine-rich repeat protein